MSWRTGSGRPLRAATGRIPEPEEEQVSVEQRRRIAGSGGMCDLRRRRGDEDRLASSEYAHPTVFDDLAELEVFLPSSQPSSMRRLGGRRAALGLWRLGECRAVPAARQPSRDSASAIHAALDAVPAADCTEEKQDSDSARWAERLRLRTRRAGLLCMFTPTFARPPHSDSSGWR